MLLPLAISSAALLGGSGEPPAFHAYAAINDVMSHGLVGDGFLSLNEAIQLHNNTLLWNQLSPAEQAQLALIPGTGTSTFLSWARLDGSSTPVITIERDLDVIVDTSYGLFLSSDNGATVFDFSGANILHGMRSTSNALQMRDIVFFGGPAGLDVVQTDIAGQIGLALNRCRFEGQSQFGLRVASTTPNGFGKVYLEGCVFDGAATGIVWDEAPAGRTSFFDVHACRITGAVNGIQLTLGSGGTGRYTLERLVVEASGTGLQLARPNGGNRAALWISRHVEVRAPTCVTIACSPLGPTQATMRMGHFWSTSPTGTSLTFGSVGDNLSGDLEELTLEGDCAIRAGGAAAPLRIHNIRAGTGTGSSVAFGTTPSQALTIADSRFDNCAVQLQGTAPLTFTNCCFAGGSLAGTAQAPAWCVGSYVQNAGANVQQTGSLPQEQLGSMHVLPHVPTIGSTITLQADLPNGLFGAFLLGFTDPVPTLLPQPLHVYGMPGGTFLLPGVIRFQQTFPWTIPNFQVYKGLDMVAQIAVLPDPGVSALPVQLPPGRRFALQ